MAFIRLDRALAGASLAAILATAAPTATAAEPIDAGAAPPAPSSDVDAARAHYKRGVDLYDQGSYEPALSELQRADELAPTYRLAYNIALVQMRLGDFAGALRSLHRYIDDGGSEVSATRRAEVDGYFADIAHRIAFAEVTTNLTDVTIAVDDHVAGKTPLLGPIEVNPGPHHVSASKAGFATQAREIDVAAGEHATVFLALVAPPPAETRAPPVEPLPPTVGPPLPPPPVVAAAAPSKAPPQSTAPPPESPTPPLWIGWTATAVLAAGAIGTGIAALAESHVVSQDVNDYATPGDVIRSAHQATVALALASDILTCSAIVAAVTTGYLTLATNRNRRAGVVDVHAGPTGIRLVTTF